MAEPKPKPEPKKAPPNPKRWLKSITEFFGLLFKGWVVILAVILSGCATLGNVQPVSVLCVSCGLLQATGACNKAPQTFTGAPACPVGEAQFVTNYVDVVRRGAQPTIECRGTE
jgi:hypothetical protein